MHLRCGQELVFSQKEGGNLYFAESMNHGEALALIYASWVTQLFRANTGAAPLSQNFPGKVS